MLSAYSDKVANSSTILAVSRERRHEAPVTVGPVERAHHLSLQERADRHIETIVSHQKRAQLLSIFLT